ncbi:MAG: DUF1015 family protein [Candidatus Rokubacteria bacterium]|nr:DUF1015 family protein [Candidatus Rokubacteria bacterium]
MRLHPFAALRPTPERAARIAAPPYDVVSRREAAALAAGNPLCFLRVTRAEIDLDENADPADPRVHARARENLDRLVAAGALVREAAPSVYVYREDMDGRAQVGVVGGVHVEDYERGVIRVHERTRPDKEDDRTRHIRALRAHAEPVLLLYRDAPEVAALVAGAMAGPALLDFTAPDGVRHTVWRPARPEPYAAAFAAVPVAYVADGHHRSASAWRAAREHDRDRQPDAECCWFPAVLCPASALRILPYNRVVKDLAGQSPEEFLARLGHIGRLTSGGAPSPPRPGAFCFYVDGRWYGLELEPPSSSGSDPVASLDVSRLQERVLGPILGVADQRTDTRIDFVGGIRGTRELEARVDSKEMALAISLYPTTVEQLMSVANAGEMMPPKSTWFEPKLASGLFVHTFD